MPYIWNTQTLLILIGLQMRLINSNNHGTLQSKIHQKTIFYRCFKETFEFEKKYLEILDHKVDNIVVIVIDSCFVEQIEKPAT
jgi:hypothetical protein